MECKDVRHFNSTWGIPALCRNDKEMKCSKPGLFGLHIPLQKILEHCYRVFGIEVKLGEHFLPQ